MPSVVLAARRAPVVEGCRPSHLTCVRSVVRPLTPPCLCQVSFPVLGRPRWRASCPRARGRARELIQAGIDPTEQELANGSDRAGARELIQAGVDPTEQELANGSDRAGARELIQAGVDPTEQELRELIRRAGA
ncbi:hypothetical protein B296_00035156 [Ensete ventricosum]|uniref:Uncharacterized protein n=1 Tax=Ensete ventricosum TaxID=4639 RepID=A0A426XKX3_ENSVE|nr:hypothetical protein B296_00035156 [Ensete ventricosum]